MDPNSVSLAAKYILNHLASESQDTSQEDDAEEICFTSSVNEQTLCEGAAASQIQYVVVQEDSLSKDIKGLIMGGSEPAGCRPPSPTILDIYGQSPSLHTVMVQIVDQMLLLL